MGDSDQSEMRELSVSVSVVSGKERVIGASVSCQR
jgi:hypothetical protein